EHLGDNRSVDRAVYFLADSDTAKPKSKNTLVHNPKCAAPALLGLRCLEHGSRTGYQALLLRVIPTGANVLGVPLCGHIRSHSRRSAICSVVCFGGLLDRKHIHRFVWGRSPAGRPLGADSCPRRPGERRAIPSWRNGWLTQRGGRVPELRAFAGGQSAIRRRRA